MKVKKQKIEKDRIDSILKFVGFNLIELKGNSVVKKDPRVCLDFNAFAQGYSVDVVSDFLNSKGITSYVVEIGGEVYAKGRPYTSRTRSPAAPSARSISAKRARASPGRAATPTPKAGWCWPTRWRWPARTSPIS